MKLYVYLNHRVESHPLYTKNNTWTNIGRQRIDMTESGRYCFMLSSLTDVIDPIIIPFIELINLSCNVPSSEKRIKGFYSFGSAQAFVNRHPLDFEVDEREILRMFVYSITVCGNNIDEVIDLYHKVCSNTLWPTNTLEEQPQLFVSRTEPLPEVHHSMMMKY